jgi:ABC-type multidrug transport system ATPase subunit
LLSEIELVASRMLIIHHGQKKVEGEVSALLDPTHTLVEIRAVDPQRARTVLADSPWKALLQPQADLRLEMNRADVPQLISYLTEAGIGLQEVNASHSLENYFLSLTTQSGHVEPFTN